MAPETETSFHAAGSWFLSLSSPIITPTSFSPTVDRPLYVVKNMASSNYFSKKLFLLSCLWPYSNFKQELKNAPT